MKVDFGLMLFVSPFVGRTLLYGFMESMNVVYERKGLCPKSLSNRDLFGQLKQFPGRV